MAQQHLDRLTPIDAGFLHQEGANSHMHIGGVLVFDGEPPAFDELLDHIRGRLHLVPRYRQKLATPPLETGRPLWIDDPTFNLEFHVRHTALPTPGTEAQLLALVARIASQQLDRTKPLWELWMVEGLRGPNGRGPEQFAIICKTHHALVDGVAGVDLATVLFDLNPEPQAALSDLEPWVPHPEPSSAELAVASVRDSVSTLAGAVAHGLVSAATPSRTVGRLRDAVEGVGEIVWAGLNPAPSTPLNVPIGPHRRYAVVRQRLADYREIKNVLGGTVNDVVLAVVSGALADWLQGRGIRTEGLELRALVPVSVRTDAHRDTLGNKLTVMRGPLPVYIPDATTRLAVVRVAMDGLKESKQAVGAATLTAVETLAPPTVLAQASRLNFSTRLFNLLVTNVPGPQLPLYLLGRQLQHLFPIAFLPENHALAIAIMSYNGAIDYGLIGDFDALDDIDVVAAGIDRALAELLEAAHIERARGEKPRAVRGLRSAPRSNGTRARAGSRPTADRTAVTAVTIVTAPDSAGAAGTVSSDGLATQPTDLTAPEAAAGSEPEPLSILPKSGRLSPDGPAAELRAKRSRSRPPHGGTPTD